MIPHERPVEPALGVAAAALLLLGFLLPGLLLFGPVLPGHLHAQSASDLSAEASRFVSVGEPVFALTNVRVVDGTGAPPREGQTIVVREGRIIALGAVAEVETPPDARILDMAGHTVIPGIVGMHNHTDYPGVHKRLTLAESGPLMYLGSGVTTIRTAGSLSPYAEVNLKRNIEAGEVPGPRVFFTGPRLSEGLTNYSAESPEAARRVVRYWKEEGAIWIKAHDRIRRDQLEAAIDEAHRVGIKFTGHLCSVTFSEAADLGIDNLEHGLYVSTDFFPDKEPDVCPPYADQLESIGRLDIESGEVRALIRKLVERDIAITSTLPVIEQTMPGRPVEDRVLEAMAPEVRSRFLERIRARDEHGDVESARAIWTNVLAFEKAFVDAGGLLAAGCDPTGNGGAIPGFADQRNLELLVEAGFSPVEAIQIMTSNGAKLLGMEEELGSIAVGKRADMVVIDGDPSAMPAEIRNVTIVFKDGVGYDSRQLLDAAKGLVGIR